MPQPTVLITGASTGIGKACALYLDRHGYRVFAGIRNPDDGMALRQAASAQLTPLILDVTKPDTIAESQAIIAQAVGQHGIQGLINNAGIAILGAVEFLPLETLRHQFEVNFFGQIAVTQAFMPLLRNGQGRIINMSSTGGRFATPFLAPYHASKFALEALSDSLRMELATWQLPVIVIEPASIATPIWEKSLAKAKQDIEALSLEAKDRYASIFQKMIDKVNDVGTIGISPDTVAATVHHALTARHPKTRYLIGMSRLRYFLATIIPDRWRDRVILSAAGIGPQPKNNKG